MYSKVSEQTKALEKLNKDLENSCNDDIWICPICKYEETIENDEDDCYVVRCPNCNYSYCIHCDYVYNPEPDFLVLLGFNSPKKKYLGINYTEEGNNKESLYIVTDYEKKKEIKNRILNFLDTKNNTRWDFSTIVNLIDDLCLDYNTIKVSDYWGLDTLTIEHGDGTYMDETIRLFECDLFF